MRNFNEEKTMNDKKDKAFYQLLILSILIIMKIYLKIYNEEIKIKY